MKCYEINTTLKVKLQLAKKNEEISMTAVLGDKDAEVTHLVTCWTRNKDMNHSSLTDNGL